MKAKPILFSTPMVQALLDGSKTMTRRAVKHTYVFDNPEVISVTQEDHGWWSVCTANDTVLIKCPYGAVGDLLYVREKFTEEACATSICYAADFPIVWPKEQTDGEEIIQEAKDYRFKPSILMLREDSRLTLEITDIRVEKLQDISEEDAKNEGVYSVNLELEEHETGACAKYLFLRLWDKINGKASTNDNPWVWCVSFKVHKINVNEFIANVS